MTPSENPFGPFKNDRLRLEAVRLRERRLLWPGLCGFVTVNVVCLFTDPTAAIAASPGTIFRALR